MNIIIERIFNKPIDSNSYVVYSKINNSCLIIDPGSIDSLDLIDFIDKNKLHPEFIFLTHEHFDHIWGVNRLKELFNAGLVCSRVCSSKIIDKKKNMSVFYNQVGFETDRADVIIEDIDYQLLWNGYTIEFLMTPGHTDASVCVLIGNNLFTGDTIIKNLKTVIKLPGGSKLKLVESISFLHDKYLKKQIIIHPGHGENFPFDEINIKDIL